MPSKPPPDRCRTTTTSEGTGDMVLNAVAPTGYQAPQDCTDEVSDYDVLIVMLPHWEIISSARSGSTLLRGAAEVLTNSNGNTAKIAWGPGQKEVVYIAPSDRLVLNHLGNIYAVLQHFSGGLGVGEDDALQITAGAGGADVLLDGATLLQLTSSAISVLQSEGDASTGPNFRLRRTRTSPTASEATPLNGPGLAFEMNDNGSGGGSIGVVGRLFVKAISVVAGSMTGALDVRLLNAGAERTVLKMRGDGSQAFPSTGLTIGKEVVNDLSVRGLEVTSGGRVNITTEGEAAIRINRKNTSGHLVTFFRDDVTDGNHVGHISVDGAGLVAYATFHAVHDTICADPADTAMLAVGTVLIADEEPYSKDLPHLPKARICREPLDRRVYGVFSGFVDSTRTVLLSSGLGTPAGVRVAGPVRLGDLLVSSEIPGVACAWRWSWRRFWELSPSQACVIGKATRSFDGPGEHFVPCVLYCG